MAKIILAPTVEEAYKAKEMYGDQIKATVEAEYGATTIQGSEITLAHHGVNAGNPAPCNTDIAHTLKENDIILISHIDLDTVGGILALEGKKPEDTEFWKAAEYVDVNGPHHAFKFSQEVQDQLNAVWAANKDRTRYAELTDVSDKIEAFSQIVTNAIDKQAPEHESAVRTGQEWTQEQEEQANARCIYQNLNVRFFITDGPFTASSYTAKDPDSGEKYLSAATVTLNMKTGAITLAFEDGGKENNAAEIMKQLFGPDAGGRAGIAGSPRGTQMTYQDAISVIEQIDLNDYGECCFTEYATAAGCNWKDGSVGIPKLDEWPRDPASTPVIFEYNHMVCIPNNDEKTQFSIIGCTGDIIGDLEIPSDVSDIQENAFGGFHDGDYCSFLNYCDTVRLSDHFLVTADVERIFGVSSYVRKMYDGGIKHFLFVDENDCEYVVNCGTEPGCLNNVIKPVYYINEYDEEEYEEYQEYLLSLYDQEDEHVEDVEPDVEPDVSEPTTIKGMVEKIISEKTDKNVDSSDPAVGDTDKNDPGIEVE